MVKIAVAGGSGKIASEIVDALAATNKHEILILSRREQAATGSIPAVKWVKVDYSDKTSLTNALSGVNTVLSFLDAVSDTGSVIQKMLIDSSVAAGVKRFAPSEWSSGALEELPWYVEKGVAREYLAEINKEKKFLEYTLFQTGLLADYLVPSGAASKLQMTQELWIDFPKRRAITLEGKGGEATLTTMEDIANVVVRAIEYDGEWPIIGGIRGTTLSISKLLEIGAKVRGPFDITTLKEEDVRAGNILSSWIPQFEATSLSKEQNEYFSKVILTGSLLSALKGSWVVSDEWNRLLPDYKFTGVEEFLAKHWAGKA